MSGEPSDSDYLPEDSVSPDANATKKETTEPSYVFRYTLNGSASIEFHSKSRCDSTANQSPQNNISRVMRLLPVARHRDKLPAAIVKEDGYILPLFGRERFEIHFISPTKKLCIWEVYNGDHNAITGSDDLGNIGLAQNYVAAGIQPPLVGFKRLDGTFHPFLGPEKTETYSHLMLRGIESIFEGINVTIVKPDGVRVKRMLKHDEVLELFLFRTNREKFPNFVGHYYWRGTILDPFDTPRRLGIRSGDTIIMLPGLASPPPISPRTDRRVATIKIGDWGPLEQYLAVDPCLAFEKLYNSSTAYDIHVWVFDETKLKELYGIDLQATPIRSEEYLGGVLPSNHEHHEAIAELTPESGSDIPTIIVNGGPSEIETNQTEVQPHDTADAPIQSTLDFYGRDSNDLTSPFPEFDDPMINASHDEGFDAEAFIAGGQVDHNTDPTSMAMDLLDPTIGLFSNEDLYSAD